MPIYSALQIFNFAEQAGFTASEAVIATAIALAESGGNSSIVNSIGATGLWQIYPAQSGSTDPLTNAKQAFAKYSAAGDWCPWAVFDEGASNGTPCPGHGLLDANGNPQRNNSWRNALPAVQAALGITPGSGDPITPPASGGSSGGSGAASGSGGGSSSGSPTDAIGNFFQDVLTGIANALKGQVPVANVGNFPVSGTVVVGGGIFFLLLGAILWKGSTVVKVAAPGSVPAKALRVAAA